MAARPVWEEPEITLSEWSIVLHPEGTAHFAGVRYDPERGRERGRVSSMIESFDAATLTGTTYSGRVYKLAAGGRADIHGVLLPRVLWGADAIAVETIGPEDLELLLRPAHGMRS